MNRATRLLASLVLALGLAGVAAAALCPKCRGKEYTDDVGRCSECSARTTSGAFELCPACSARLHQCEHCRAALPAPAPNLVLGEEDRGKTVRATVGQVVVVRLPGNPTTGYRWEVRAVEGQAVRQVGEVGYVAKKVPRGVVGSGGTFLAVFRAVRPGRGEVRMAYARPWEKGKPPEKTFHATIAVQRPKPR
ncbi:MAG: protease inhibitor I42 family protein [Candidatus Brocadiia bacterium]